MKLSFDGQRRRFKVGKETLLRMERKGRTRRSDYYPFHRMAIERIINRWLIKKLGGKKRYIENKKREKLFVQRFQNYLQLDPQFLRMFDLGCFPPGWPLCSARGSGGVPTPGKSSSARNSPLIFCATRYRGLISIDRLQARRNSNWLPIPRNRTLPFEILPINPIHRGFI